MWQDIEKEKRVADHLLYVSLKYTKTCDVILNLIARWKTLTELCIDELLRKEKAKKKIKKIPLAPKLKTDMLEKLFKKNEIVKETLKLHYLFKKIPRCEQIREGEFRKNVALTVIESGKTTIIDLEKLKEWQDLLEKFISFIKQF